MVTGQFALLSGMSLTMAMLCGSVILNGTKYRGDFLRQIFKESRIIPASSHAHVLWAPRLPEISL